jgi:Zinc-ribbon/Ring finger domain
MSNNELPYHCDQCGFCRVGGRDNFTHCNDCGMCIDSQLFDDHNCKAGKYMSNCPICQEDLFSSRFASHEMPCGHAIHWDCFKELTSYDTRCPVCKKTAESPEHMQATWTAIAMGIALQPVPPELVRVVNIFCNDCEVSDPNRRWHFLGVQCLNCTSFNTIVESIVLTGYEGATFLDNLEQTQQQQQQQQQQNMNMDDDNGQLENGIPTSIVGIPTSITAVTNMSNFMPSFNPSNDYFNNDENMNDEEMDE